MALFSNYNDSSIFIEINANVKKGNVKLKIESHVRESQKGEVGE